MAQVMDIEKINEFEICYSKNLGNKVKVWVAETGDWKI